MDACRAKDLGKQIGCAVEHSSMLLKRWVCIEKALKLDELSYRFQRSSVLLDDSEQIKACRLRELVPLVCGVLTPDATFGQSAMD